MLSKIQKNYVFLKIFDFFRLFQFIYFKNSTFFENFRFFQIFFNKKLYIKVKKVGFLALAPGGRRGRPELAGVIGLLEYYAIAALFVGIRRLRRASLTTPPRTHPTPSPL